MTPSSAARPQNGGLILSLDFELLWGVRDRASAIHYRENLLGARRAIPQILALLAEYEMAATWATVGFLFAESREELRDYLPSIQPRYARSGLSPYEDWGSGSQEDEVLRYAPALIAQIAGTKRQEVGCHTFSHYYCLEPGQSKQAFSADLESAVALAQQRGITLRSIVFPRNQVNESYLDLLPKFGFTNYRGIEDGWMFSPRPDERNSSWRKAGRLLDGYVSRPGRGLFAWDSLPTKSGLANVRGSMFLRPYAARLRALETVRLRRINGAIRQAAEQGQLFHLWWHPHNFGRQTAENLSCLRSILETFAECRQRFGIESLSMAESAARVLPGARLKVSAA